MDLTCFSVAICMLSISEEIFSLFNLSFITNLLPTFCVNFTYKSDEIAILSVLSQGGTPLHVRFSKYLRSRPFPPVSSSIIFAFYFRRGVVINKSKADFPPCFTLYSYIAYKLFEYLALSFYPITLY